MYALIEDEWAEVATYADREGYFAAINRYFGLKAADGKSQDAPDVVLGLLMQPTVVARGRFGLLKRALRHFDEIGISSELVDAIDEVKGEGAQAVGWGATAEELANMAPYDFGDMVI